MPVYAYQVMDAGEEPRRGTLSADSPRVARDQLRERGLTVISIREQTAKVASRWWALRRRKRNRASVLSFTRELATLLGAGIPLLDALGTLQRQHTGGMKAVVQDLAEQVAGGSSLAEAMGRHPTFFDALHTSIVRVGEDTGDLDHALQRLANFQEKAQGLRNKVTTALLYPAVVSVVGIAVCIFLMTYVVPNLLETLEQSGKELPAMTRAVQAVSNALLHWWWAMLLGVGALILGGRLLLQSKRGKLATHKLLLNLPVLGDLIRKENTSRMAVVLSALLRSGLPFVEAIAAVRGTLKNEVFRRAMDEYEQAVLAGGDISGPLEKTGVFAPMVAEMLAVGQQSGQLEDMLEQLAAGYDREVDTAASRMTALLEPLLIVILAVLVGCIAFATILPMIEVSNVL